MIKIAFINQLTGLINFIAVPANDLMYNEDEQYGDSIAKHIPFESDDTTVLETWHWDGTSFQQHDKQQYEYQIWDNSDFSWKLPSNYLEIIRNNGITEINQLTNTKILQKYPIHLQLNLPYDFGQDSVEVQTMRSWIDNIRDLSNQANSDINTSITKESIDAIIDSFKIKLNTV